jgi:hypothetical protein
MAIKNLLIKNNHYENVRLTIVGSQSGVEHYYYTEASGNRYYYTALGGTAAPDMESATFDSFLSFTMSGAVTYQYNLIPMLPEESVMIETNVVGINLDGSKGYVMKSFGGYRHNGSSLSLIGGSIDYTTKTDFTTASASFVVVGTQSVALRVTGQTSQTIDWNVYIRYTKGFHALTFTGPVPPPKPIYPQSPSS